MSKSINRIKDFLRNDQIEIRIRMLLVLQYAVVIACVIGTVSMISLKQSFLSMLPNVILLVLTLFGMHLSHVSKKYELAALLIIIGCADIVLPMMFFMAGGNDSGMPFWFMFGVVVACLMSTGTTRVFMTSLALIIDVVCMLIGHYHPELVTPLEGESAAFYDGLWSLVTVSVGLVIILVIHLMTYERQRWELEMQRRRLTEMTQRDELTGTYSRHAYYDDCQDLQKRNNANRLAVVAMDVNGLKRVNDTLGHAEGDAYLQSAAGVMREAFGIYGKIYRLGGDEFMAVLDCGDVDDATLKNRLENSIRGSEDARRRGVSIALGIVRLADFTEMSLHEIEKLADARMYEDKKAYYQKKE